MRKFVKDTRVSSGLSKSRHRHDKKKTKKNKTEILDKLVGVEETELLVAITDIRGEIPIVLDILRTHHTILDSLSDDVFTSCRKSPELKGLVRLDETE